MARIVFLLIATLVSGNAYAQLDLNLGVSGSRSYYCLADFTDSGIGYGVRVEMAGDLNDRFQFIGNLSYDRHNSEYSSLPVMAGLRVSTTSDDDMFCYVQATAGSFVPGHGRGRQRNGLGGERRNRHGVEQAGCDCGVQRITR